MPRKTMSLGDLHEMMQKYRTVLERSGATQAYDRNGKVYDVDDAKVRKALESLDTAINDVGEICQDAVLAIIVDSE